MMKIKVGSLIGMQLDYAVAFADGILANDTSCDDGNKVYYLPIEGSPRLIFGIQKTGLVKFIYSPSTLWNQAGEIIEREFISLIPCCGLDGNYWEAVSPAINYENGQCITGKTPMEAAMRCFVLIKIGFDVEVPKLSI
jgi:hypothetical protein